MRARLMMKVMGLIMMLVLTVITAHSCQSSPASSPLNPSTFGSNGLAGVCADQEAAAQADGDDSPQTVVVPSEAGSLSKMAASAGLNPGTFSCNSTTTTTSPFGNP